MLELDEVKPILVESSNIDGICFYKYRYTDIQGTRIGLKLRLNDELPEEYILTRINNGLAVIKGGDLNNAGHLLVRQLGPNKFVLYTSTKDSISQLIEIEFEKAAD